MTFWESDLFHTYEVAYGDAPGTRTGLLASADWQTQVIDLTGSEAELWRGVRRSYKALIHRIERSYVIDAAGSIYSAMKIHDQEAGRQTRPTATWAIQGEWLRDGHALLTSAGIRGLVDMTMAHDQWPRFEPLGLIDMRGYAYFTVWDGHAYYFSGASLDPNISHALIWTAMKALKARGVQTLELGWLTGDTEKDRGIAKFKRGFGGMAIPAKTFIQREMV